jgi:hypothetical protein
VWQEEVGPRMNADDTDSLETTNYANGTNEGRRSEKRDERRIGATVGAEDGLTQRHRDHRVGNAPGKDLWQQRTPKLSSGSTL